MKVLIVYATYSGGTLAATEVLAETVRKTGLELEIMEAANCSLDDFARHDLVFLGSPSWSENGQEGQPHRTFIDLFNSGTNKSYPVTLFALYGLGDRTYRRFCGAVDWMSEAVKKLHGIILTPQLRIDNYFGKQEENNAAIRLWLHDIIKNLPPINGGRPSHL